MESKNTMEAPNIDPMAGVQQGQKRVRSKLEYLWLDGNMPTQLLRGKCMVVDNFSGKLEDCPEWCFDGSSTKQAPGNSSDCLLIPVYICTDPCRRNAFIVMCEVMNPDGTPHSSNMRNRIKDDDDDFWFGFEQEYVLMDNKTGKPVGWPNRNFYPPPQGPNYCGVGAQRVCRRDIMDEHLDICIDAGLNIEGTNGEVMLGSWEYQIFNKGAKRAGDEIWISRYFMMRLCEKYDVSMDLTPKPIPGDWNGTGMHANFSCGAMRTAGKRETFATICEHFGKNIKRHISVYGDGNDKRLTGAHETQSIDKFSWGESDRGASIRVPISCVRRGYKGRLEDRRPAANADPYAVAMVIVQTTKEALGQEKKE